MDHIEQSEDLKQLIRSQDQSETLDPKVKQIWVEHRQKLIDQAEELYLEYFNNFLTVEAFASFYGISAGFALKLIEAGEAVNYLRSIDVIEMDL